MRKDKPLKILNFLLILFFLISIISILISFIFNVDFVEKYIDRDNRIGDHVKTRIALFQTQMFYLSCVFGFIGILALAFKRRILKFLHLHPEILTNLIFLLFIILILFSIGELSMRIFFHEKIYQEYGHGPEKSEFLKKIEYNSLGYRDVEHDLAKEKDTYRILFLGDSFTLGSGIESIENIYPKLIQTKLNENYGDDKFETIILAKSGYSTLDELKALKEVGLKFNPDLIIIGYYLNDAEGENSRKGYENMFYSHYLIPYELGNILYRHSFFYYFLESRLKNIIVSKGFGKNNIDYTQHLYSNSNPYFQQHEKELKEMIGLSNKNGIPIVIVMIPSLEILEDYPHENIHQYIKSISESNDAYFLDLLPYFKNYNLDELRLSFMDTHMSESGHKITADKILTYLQEYTILN